MFTTTTQWCIHISHLSMPHLIPSSDRDCGTSLLIGCRNSSSYHPCKHIHLIPAPFAPITMANNPNSTWRSSVQFSQMDFQPFLNLSLHRPSICNPSPHRLIAIYKAPQATETLPQVHSKIQGQRYSPVQHPPQYHEHKH